MISDVGTLGATSDKNSATGAVSLSVPRDVPVGAIVVVWVAWDSVFNIAFPTSGYNFFKPTDSAGNVYTNIAADTDSTAFFSSGAYGGIYITQVRNALTTSDTITSTTFSSLIGTLVAKTISAWEFSIDDGNRWAKGGNTYSGEVSRGVDPPDISYAPGFTREWLWLYGLAAEAPSTDTYTLDADYTAIDSAGTTGGAADSNITILGGWRIDELASDTVSVTSDTADRNYTQLLVTVCEVSQRAFPERGVLDDFQRANENPLDNGTWNLTRTAFGGARAQLVSNAATGGGGSFWDEEFTDCVEVYMTTTDAERWSAIHFHGQGTAATATMDGYVALWEKDWGGVVDGTLIQFGRSGNQGEWDPAGILHVFADAGDDFKSGQQRCLDNTSGEIAHHLWLDIGAGWEEIAAYLYPGFPGSALNSGNLALGFMDGNPRGDDFGGGQIRCRRSQAIRYR